MIKGPKKSTRLKKPRMISRQEIADLVFVNSKRLPATINDGGRCKRWVGIGWVDEGPATGQEDAVVFEVR